MKIDKENLRTMWYEDKDGNEIKEEPCEENGWRTPKEASYYSVQKPLVLRTVHSKLISQDEVDKCRHPRKYIVPTYGWIDGVVGRECKLCNGTQTKHKWHFWPRKWDGRGSRVILTGECTYNGGEEAIISMVNSGEYSLGEAIMVYANACERCMNVLLHKYTNGKDGYEEFSEDWKKAGTSCKFCGNDTD